MEDYKVEIVETLKRTVLVSAESKDEAESIVRDQYHNQDHVLTSDDFVDVDFVVKDETMAEKENTFWLQLKQQCGDLDIRIRILSNFTDEQVAEVDKRMNDAMDCYGKENNDDYCEFDHGEAFEKVLEDMGIVYEYPPVDRTIYI